MILKINGEKFQKFSRYTINLNYDSVASSFNFSALQDFAPTPFGYDNCTIENDNGELLITGTILNLGFAATKKEQLISLSGYSLPGVLEDSQIPASIYPLQSDKLTLKEIIDKVLAPFNIGYEVDPIVSAEFNQVYAKSNAEQGESVKTYINRLASQKGIILTHTEEGDLFFTELQPSKLLAAAVFEEGDAGLLKMNLQTDGQAAHSEISILRQASKKSSKALESTIKNPYCKPTRTKTKNLNADSTNLLDVEKAARNELGAELDKMIKLTIITTKFVKPGNLIQFKAPTLRIKNFVDFFVQSTTITGNIKSELYTLKCVLKDVYTTDEVKNIFI